MPMWGAPRPGGSEIQAASPVGDVFDPVLWEVLTSSTSDLCGAKPKRKSNRLGNKIRRKTITAILFGKENFPHERSR